MQKAWKYWRLFWVLTSSGWKCQVLTKLFCQSRWWGGCCGSGCSTWTGDASHSAGQPHHSSLQPKPTGAVSPVTCQLPASTSVIGWGKKRASKTRGDVKWNPLLLMSARMNQAPTSGFEEDVGTRTTHHVMYPESAKDLDNGTSLVLIPFKTLDLQWVISALTTGTIKQ